ncbi:hypothetical protein [Mycolicibacterium sp.]|uniref:hypothetical protein n=1 Tax=Mycolicibacterium sp. TaxID=2320850 RepID=UPI0037CA00BB
MSQPSIDAHHKKWDALPPFPDYPYVMQDDDVESWSDLLYFRGLADAIEDQVHKLAADPIGVHQVQLARLHSATEVDVLATTPVPAGMLDPWPTDLSNGLLAAWRDGIEDEPEPEAVEPPAKRGGALLLVRRILCVILSLGVLFGIGAAWWITDAKAAPDPYWPIPPVWCPGGGTQTGWGGYCDGATFPDGTKWHTDNFVAPFVGRVWNPIVCVVADAPAPPPVAGPGGCGGAVR